MSRRTTKKVTKQRGRERDGGDQIRERKGKIKKTRKEGGKKERDIKHNEKDTFTPPFNGEKGEMGNECLIKSTFNRLSVNSQITSKIC